MSSNYLEITIGGQQIEITDGENFPFSLDYRLEDEQNFQIKKGSEAVDVTIPATLVNRKIANSFEQVGVEDMTPENVYRTFQPVVVKHGGYELMVGRALLTKATEDYQGTDYTFNFFSDNSDWAISLKEVTLWDLLKHVKLPFTKQHIIDSWQFDGSDEALPYVFAPVRYGTPMDSLRVNSEEITDINMQPAYLKPSISKYWLLYWAFKSIGYRLQSDFFDTTFFRRQVCPWTWGSFLYSDGTRISNLDFRAKGISDVYKEGDFDGVWDLATMNDSSDGMFDNNGVYSYNNATKEMTWKYLPTFNYGNLDAYFFLNTWIDAYASNNSDILLKVQWFRNSVHLPELDKILVDLNAPPVGIGDGRRRTFFGNVQAYATINVNPGDKVTARFHLHIFDSGWGSGRLTARVDEFALEHFRIPLGGTIDFENFTSLKKYKFLDLFRGVIDEFNLSIKTDTVNKVILTEPTHEYKLPGESASRKGFFNGDSIDWSDKQDVARKSDRILFSDNERELIFRYKNDPADGLQKKVQDRNSLSLSTAKYVLPDRFKAGKKEHENRFFSATMHYIVDQWKNITGNAPQMVALVPENISNTAKDEAQNTFLPKSCYYKGVVHGYGWIFDGSKQSSFPLMFSVNYLAGGEKDPVLSYSNERIGPKDIGKVAKGLASTFFLQRMAIMRNGEWYSTWFRLNNYDVVDQTHREFKSFRNQKWELTSIYNYAPLKNQSTNVLLRRWMPIAIEDAESLFPSDKSVVKNGSNSSFDLPYQTLLAFTQDLPQ